jgi:hypothetical protein
MAYNSTVAEKLCISPVDESGQEIVAGFSLKTSFVEVTLERPVLQPTNINKESRETERRRDGETNFSYIPPNIFHLFVVTCFLLALYK